jgi:hypothetical protein
VGCLSEQCHDGFITPRRSEQQVSRHLLIASLGIPEHGRGTLMPQFAFGRRKSLVDRIKDQGVDEGQRLLVLHDVGAGQDG